MDRPGSSERFGYGTARGSTSRGGARALVQLRRELAAGQPAGFTLDGPRGPARVAQPGAVFLAGATGHPLLPFHIEAVLQLDDEQLGPDADPEAVRPVALAIGEPLYVPDTRELTLEAARSAVEVNLAVLERACGALLETAPTFSDQPRR